MLYRSYLPDKQNSPAPTMLHPTHHLTPKLELFFWNRKSGVYTSIVQKKRTVEPAVSSSPIITKESSLSNSQRKATTTSGQVSLSKHSRSSPSPSSCFQTSQSRTHYGNYCLQIHPRQELVLPRDEGEHGKAEYSSFCL
jgi:hypothetical protein